MTTNKERIFCTWAEPWTDRWAALAKWGPHIKDGWYCPEHAKAIDTRGLDKTVRVLEEVNSN